MGKNYLFLIFAIFISLNLVSQNCITVVDAKTKLPIVGVKVIFENFDNTLLSNRAGKFYPILTNLIENVLLEKVCFSDKTAKLNKFSNDTIFMDALNCITVVDFETKLPIEDVTIIFPNSYKTLLTNMNGNFSPIIIDTFGNYILKKARYTSQIAEMSNLKNDTIFMQKQSSKQNYKFEYHKIIVSPATTVWNKKKSEKNGVRKLVELPAKYKFEARYIKKLNIYDSSY